MEPRPSNEETERALVVRTLKADRDAAGELAASHWDELFRIAHLILRDVHAAEDVTQEALIAALTSLDSFDVERPLRPWLIRIVTNRALDQSRLVKRRRESPSEAVPEGALGSSDRPHADRNDLRDALEALDPDSRALLVLRYVLDYRSSEISSLLDIPATTVRSRLKRSLDQLRQTITVEAT